MIRKAYVGDGVYIEQDEYGYTLTAENGIRATDTIILEPQVFSAMNAIVNHWHEADAEREALELVNGEDR